MKVLGVENDIYFRKMLDFSRIFLVFVVENVIFVRARGGKSRGKIKFPLPKYDPLQFF